MFIFTYNKILNNPILFNIISIIIIYILLSLFDPSVAYAQDRYPAEAYASYYNPVSNPNSQYTPYNLNYVDTTEGYRVELENRQIYGNRVELENNDTYGNRVPNPSHYPDINIQDPNLGERIPHPSHFNCSKDNVDVPQNNHNVRFEPTESEIMDQGYYYHNSKTSLEYIPQKPKFIDRFKKKYKDLNHAIEKDLREDYAKTIERRNMVGKSRAGRSSNSVEVETYIRGTGKVSTAELRKLNAKGYIIKNGRVVKS
jgi:hypothetical protein